MIFHATSAFIDISMSYITWLKKFQVAITLTIAIALVSLLVIDNNSPLEITNLRLSWFGEAWNAFIAPGALILLWPVAGIFELVCTLGGGCAGLLDGGPVDRYFFFVLSILIGLLYGFIGLGLGRLVKKLLSKG